MSKVDKLKTEIEREDFIDDGAEPPLEELSHSQALIKAI